MRSAVYIVIFLHFARKTISKISESKEERARRLVASMEETNAKIYRDMLLSLRGTSIPPTTRKNSYEIVKDLVKQKYPSITAKS